MNIVRSFAVSIALAALWTGARGPAQALPPPPPPPSYDPQQGPFDVALDGRGEIGHEQTSVIDNAWASWRGPKLEAFIICYVEAANHSVDWTRALKGLDSVAHVFKARGASIVIAAGRLCDAPAARVQKSGPYVEIRGVIRG